MIVKAVALLLLSMQSATVSAETEAIVSDQPEALIELPQEFHGRWRYSVSKCKADGFPEEGLLISYLMTTAGADSRPTSPFFEIRRSPDQSVSARSNSWGELKFSTVSDREIVIERISDGREFKLVLCSRVERELEKDR